MAKGSFIFYDSILESIEVLTSDQSKVNEAMGAVVRYGVRGEEYTGDDPIIKCAMLQAKPLIDANKRKTHEGGAPTGNQNARKHKNNDRNKDSLFQNKDSLKKNKDSLKKNKHSLKKNKHSTIIDVDVDVDVDVDKDIDKENNLRDIQDVSLSQGVCDASTEVNEITSQKIREMADAKRIATYYNQQILATRSRFVQCLKVDGQREGYILARLKEYGEEKVKRAIDLAMVSPFFNEVANSGVRNLTWLMRPNNFIKVLEGNYNREEKGQESPSYVDESRDYSDDEEFWRKG